MRYLLIFHSNDTGQWRCLDTATLGACHPLHLDDLAEALNAAAGRTVPWMLGRREFGHFQSDPRTDPDSIEQIQVHMLDPDRAVMSQGQDYQGAWLEMFMAQNIPLGWIAARRTASHRVDAVAGLQARVADPLQARDEACQQTMEQMRVRQDARPVPELPQGPLAKAAEKV